MIYGCICLFADYVVNNLYSIYYHETNSCGVALRRSFQQKELVEDLTGKYDNSNFVDNLKTADMTGYQLKKPRRK